MPTTLDLTDSPLEYATEKPSSSQWQHLYILPVLFMEYLALALTRAVLPGLLLQQYGHRVYMVHGLADCVRGLLAFVACPLFGRVSDVSGRRLCLLVTVLGTCAPVCSLSFFDWEPNDQQTVDAFSVSSTNDISSMRRLGLLVTDDYKNSSMNAYLFSALNQSGEWVTPHANSDWVSFLTYESESTSSATKHPHAITMFMILVALSGICSSTFTLVFAYISDTVRKQEERVSAYGLALATFGLSYTIGPMTGGYLAQYNKQYVFMSALLLTILDLIYIYFVLPESRQLDLDTTSFDGGITITNSIITMDQMFSWSPWETIRILAVDPFLRKVGEVAFLYYTAQWAIISTLSLYAVQRFHLSAERLGELMSALGFCTMVAEAVLVRYMVPLLGERRAMKVGLISFAIQCVFLGCAYKGWHLFVYVLFSLLGNLVYPSLSSLVSGSVDPAAVGEALGAVNGVKAVTEGFGPLVFGSLMTLSEHSALPGWPYLLAALFVVLAFKAADELPGIESSLSHVYLQ